MRGKLLRAALALAALEAFNRWQESAAGPVRWPLPGPARYYLWDEGRIFYTVAGPSDAPALLLVHGINAAAFSYEMRKQLAPPLTERYQVYALDLLGFGQSDRPPLRYTPELYIHLIGDFIRDVIAAPAHVVASSLSAAYAISAKTRDQRAGRDLIERLVLICPTGLQRLNQPPSAVGEASHAVLRSPVVGQALFNLVASKPSLWYYLLQRTYYWARFVPPEMVARYYDSSHQLGARWAPASFLGGGLNHDVAEDWSQIRSPTLIVWGRQASFTPVEDASAFLAGNPAARLHVFERCGLLPHDEYAPEFNEMVAAFFAGDEASDAASVGDGRSLESQESA
ncbi:MAG TPA: alpha/beta fold hydrolase [Ardenticatenaceae bacterium]|nr:alpha/beta fold hydrolase [Ardenticatenaceae bacterium]